ncbi:MAG TPA: DUF1707 domain-containing protein [Micromonosporaceae bacterium]
MSSPAAGIPGEPGRIRASDTEREEFARIVREAVGEGRLTLDEGDGRLATIYASKFRDELHPLIRDLPAGDPARQALSATGRRSGGGRPADAQAWPAVAWSTGHHGTGYRGMPRRPGGLIGHLWFVAMVAALLSGLWALSGAQFFWPIIPLAFLTVGLIRHGLWRWHAGGFYRGPAGRSRD